MGNVLNSMFTVLCCTEKVITISLLVLLNIVGSLILFSGNVVLSLIVFLIDKSRIICLIKLIDSYICKARTWAIAERKPKRKIASARKVSKLESSENRISIMARIKTVFLSASNIVSSYFLPLILTCIRFMFDCLEPIVFELIVPCSTKIANFTCSSVVLSATKISNLSVDCLHHVFKRLPVLIEFTYDSVMCATNLLRLTFASILYFFQPSQVPKMLVHEEPMPERKRKPIARIIKGTNAQKSETAKQPVPKGDNTKTMEYAKGKRTIGQNSQKTDNSKGELSKVKIHTKRKSQRDGLSPRISQ